MNKFKTIPIIIALLLMPLKSEGADDELIYSIAPTQLPHVLREMKTAGFWIDRLEQPDAVMMDAPAIEVFNRHVQEELKLTKDILKMPDPIDGRALKEELSSRLDELKGKGYFGKNGEKASEKFFVRAQKLMALKKIKEVQPLKYGFIVRYAHQRFFPTDEGLYAAALDIDFDELQNNALDVATPVVILHTSADKKWLYVASQASDGWVKAEKVTLCDRKELVSFLGSASWVVATAAKADLYLDETLGQFYDYVLMGIKFPLVDSTNPNALAVLLPTRSPSGTLELKTAYIKKDQASLGFLPFTPRTVFEQAFKLLNAPYGWGGMGGEQDCSRFLQEVFASVGINLPRNSKDQAQVGKRIASFGDHEPDKNKVSALKKIAAGNIILPMKGHILLYLGTVNARPYAIHAVWGFREPTPDGDRVRVINRVTVSDLTLGEGSQKGSLLQRLNGLVALTNP